MSNDGIDYVRAGMLTQTPAYSPEWKQLVARSNEATLREARARMSGLDMHGVRIKRLDQELRNRERIARGQRPLGQKAA